MPVQEQKMIRTSISIPEPQAKVIDKRVEAGEFPNVSEFHRAAVREYNERHPVPAGVA